MSTTPSFKHVSSICGSGAWRVTYEDGKVIGVELWETDDSGIPALTYEVLDITSR